MKNAIILHGTGGAPDHYWFPWLKSELEKKGYKVNVPQLPNTNSPDIKVSLPFALENLHFDEQTILIGHSSGSALILSILENIDVRIKQAILVAGFYKQLGEMKTPILQDNYNWEKIKNHCSDLVFINSDNDPWGCDDEMGREMQEKLGGRLIVLHEGHMGSTSYNQPYREFPLLLDLI